jgi:hypothetical protein
MHGRHAVQQPVIDVQLFEMLFERVEAQDGRIFERLRNAGGASVS